MKLSNFLAGSFIALVAIGFFGYDYIAPVIGLEEEKVSAQQEKSMDHEGKQTNSNNSHSQAKLTDKSSSHGSEKATAKKTAKPKHGKSENKRMVHLTEDQLKPLNIRIATAEEGNARSEITRPATIKFNADNLFQVGPRVSAKVEKILVDLGEMVQKNERIALMSSTKLGKARADYITAKARLETEQANYKREKKLFEQDISSEAAMLEAKARFKEAQANLKAARETLRLYGLDEETYEGINTPEEKPLSFFYLSSPKKGILQQRSVKPGQTVDPNETPFHVVNTESMWVMIDAYEQDIPYLKQGQTVTLDVRSLAGKTFTGKVDWVSEELDRKTRTIPVRATVQNKNNSLKSGMYAQTTIKTKGPKKTALVPVNAVQTVHRKSVVFVPGTKTGEFRAVPVKTGAENQGKIEILSGLRPGEKYVAKGAFDLKSVFTAKSRSASH